jgi:hypothetical protein
MLLAEFLDLMLLEDISKTFDLSIPKMLSQFPLGHSVPFIFQNYKVTALIKNFSEDKEIQRILLKQLKQVLIDIEKNAIQDVNQLNTAVLNATARLPIEFSPLDKEKKIPIQLTDKILDIRLAS